MDCHLAIPHYSSFIAFTFQLFLLQVLTKLKRRALGRASTKLFAPERKPGFSMVTNKARNDRFGVATR